MRHRRRGTPGSQRRFLAAVLGVASLATGMSACGDETAPPSSNVAQAVAVPLTSNEPGAEERRDVYFQVVAEISEEPFIDTLWTPASLAEALPNQVIDIPGDSPISGRSPASSLAVVGEVVKVEPGPAVRHSDKDEDEATPVDFFDPGADERAALVTVSVKQAWGTKEDLDSVVVRFGSLGLPPDQLLSALAALGDIAVVLNEVEDASTYVPAMFGALVGVVQPDGSLSFPGLGSTEKDFTAGINTVAAPRVAATVTRLPVVLD